MLHQLVSLYARQPITRTPSGHKALLPTSKSPSRVAGKAASAWDCRLHGLERYRQPRFLMQSLLKADRLANPRLWNAAENSAQQALTPGINAERALDYSFNLTDGGGTDFALDGNAPNSFEGWCHSAHSGRHTSTTATESGDRL